MFEIAGVPEELAHEALRLAAYKLPIKSKIVKNEAFDAEAFSKMTFKERPEAVAGEEETGGEQDEGK
jgi:hypothetical protein